MPLRRVLEPEVMDSPEEAGDYDSMDHGDVNRLFVSDLLAVRAAGCHLAVCPAVHYLQSGWGWGLESDWESRSDYSRPSQL